MRAAEVTVKLDTVIGGLLGVAFGLRALDDRRAWWARAAYGAVGFDLLSNAWKGEELLQMQPATVGKIGLLNEKAIGPLKFQEKKVRSIQERVAYIHEQIVRSTRDPDIYKLARNITSHLPEKNSLKGVTAMDSAVGEITAIHAKVQERIRYTFDPLDYDAFQTARKTWELRTGDCLPADTLVLSAGYKFKPIGEVREGDVIMGDGAWTKVTKFWDKGEKKLLAFDLNNGCVLRCTPDHKLFVIPKVKSGKQYFKSGPRSGAVEIRAGDIKVGDDLLSPESLPVGRESLGVDKGWLLGVFAADGWGEEYRAAISGKDGHPKEAQKRRVKEICDRLGVSTRWHERYIAINDPPLAKWLGACGHGALQKHIPSLDLDAESVASVLEGLQADSGVAKSGTRVFGTISEYLAMQERILLRMQGKSAHIVKVDDHGGLGVHPIYRITERASATHRPHPRVRAIRESRAERVVDIETDTHRFYLPESDVIAHNCDDMVILEGALLRTIGIPYRTRVVQTVPFKTFNHIYGLAKLPNGKWTALDPIMKDKPAGWQVPRETMVVEPYDADVEERSVPHVPKVKA